MQFRENLPAWSCFYDRKDVFKGFLRRALLLNEGQGEGRELTIPEKTNYLVFIINAFQCLADEIVGKTVLSLAGLQTWHCLSDGRFRMEICLNHKLGLTEKWRRLVKRESKQALKRGVPFDPSALPEAKFLRNLVEEFLEVLDRTVFLQKPCIDNDNNDNDGLDVHYSGSQPVDDACVLYCERFVEFLIDLLSQLPTRRYICNLKLFSFICYLAKTN